MILLPLDVAESWQEHFADRSWTSMQDQIDAGYPLYCQPVPLVGEYEEVVDFEVTASARITAEVGFAEVVEGAGCTVGVDYSDDGTTWTETDDVRAVFAASARYGRVRLEATSDGTGLWKIYSLSMRMDAKEKTDAGNGTAVATDSGGTRVNLNKSFSKITSITATPSGSVMSSATVEVDDSDPTGFQVFLFDTTGTRTSGQIQWTARGY